MFGGLSARWQARSHIFISVNEASRKLVMRQLLASHLNLIQVWELLTKVIKQQEMKQSLYLV
jgi:hypothetical protein